MPSDIFSEYDTSRAPGTDLSVLCHAPFVSLNFDQSGRVTACCYNRDYALGTYPESSLSEIWNGEPARMLREAFLTGANAPGCDRCFAQLKGGNFAGTLMRNFDRFSGNQSPRAGVDVGPPLVLEFELSNTCSLECVMCGGHWSSAIRAHREKLPPLPNPYDTPFLEQLEKLLPSVVMVRFLGGEPFLINAYHHIWERMRELCPQAELSITTSGAVVPDRPRRLLDQLRAHIVVSLDGITPGTYEAIRRNASFDTVMASIADFRAYTREKGTTLSVACCPMVSNWHELRGIVEFCEARDINIFFNTVTDPPEWSLMWLPEAQLANVVARLEESGREAVAGWSRHNAGQWHGLLSQLRQWLADKQVFLWLPDSLRHTYPEETNPALVPWAVLHRAIRDELSRAPSATSAALHQYLHYLLVTQAAAEKAPMSAAALDVLTVTAGRMEDAAALVLGLDAVVIFHRARRLDDGTRMNARAALIRDAAVRGLTDGALQELRKIDVYNLYQFLNGASDEAFDEALRQFS